MVQDKDPSHKGFEVLMRFIYPEIVDKVDVSPFYPDVKDEKELTKLNKEAKEYLLMHLKKVLNSTHLNYGFRPSEGMGYLLKFLDRYDEEQSGGGKESTTSPTSTHRLVAEIGKEDTGATQKNNHREPSEMLAEKAFIFAAVRFLSISKGKEEMVFPEDHTGPLGVELSPKRCGYWDKNNPEPHDFMQLLEINGRSVVCGKEMDNRFGQFISTRPLTLKWERFQVYFLLLLLFSPACYDLRPHRTLK